MKRLLLFLSFFIPFSLFAQTTIDYDTVGQSWVFNVFANGPSGSNADYSVVANPSVGGINTSANCGKFIAHPDGLPFAGAFSGDLPDFTLTADNCIIRVMVYKDVISDFNLKLEGSINHDTKVPNTLINQWELLTFDYSADIGATIATLTLIPDFSPDPRTYGSTNYFDNISFNTSIPVELTSFTASYIGQTVNLNWTTATEINNYGFEIQRSSEGENFATVGFVQGKGTTTQTSNYNFVDKNISSHTEYSYILKQIDFDGHYSFSNVINLGASLPVSLVLDQNYPNPFNPSTTITFALPFKSNVNLNVYNLVGEEVMAVFNGNLDEGTYKYNIDASNLSSGIYIYSLSTSSDNGISSVITKKMTLLK